MRWKLEFLFFCKIVSNVVQFSYFWWSFVIYFLSCTLIILLTTTFLSEKFVSVPFYAARSCENYMPQSQPEKFHRIYLSSNDPHTCEWALQMPRRLYVHFSAACKISSICVVIINFNIILISCDLSSWHDWLSKCISSVKIVKVAFACNKFLTNAYLIFTRIVKISFHFMLH